MEPERVGIVGVGLLGTAIVDRLRAAGFDVIGFDLDSSNVNRAGIRCATGLAEIGGCPRVILCLPDTDVVESVVDDCSGFFERGCPEFVIDTTTGHPPRVREIAERLARRGCTFVDACVSGSSTQMRAGEALLLVGASDAALDANRDLLDALSSVVFHVGGVGTGLELKLVSSLMLGLQRLALAEALHLADRFGLSKAAVLEVLRAGPAYCPAMDTKGPKMLEGDYEPQARLHQHRKDVRLILDQARALGAQLPLSRAHKRVLDAGIEMGLGDRDNSAVLERLAAE